MTGELYKKGWLLIVLSVAMVLSEQAALAKEKGLIAYWKFDEGKGQKVIDSSGNGNHGIIHGATWTKGIVGGGLQFDGKDDYIDIPKSASLDSFTNQITLMAWVKASVSRTHVIFERWLYGGTLNERAFILYIDREGVTFGLSSGHRSAWMRSTRLVPQDRWVHVAATCDGTTMKIYINGQLDPAPSLTPPRKIHASSGNLHIGRWYAEGIWNSAFKGVIDEARIYSRALTAAEILEYYRKTSLKGIIKGTVKDTDGKPIEKAIVSAGPFQAITDAVGNYEAEVPIDTYRLIATKKHYRRVSKSDIEVKQGQTTIVNFQLVPDKTPPVISNLKATNVAGATAVITWTTNEPCSSLVKFGTSSGKYTRKAVDPAYTTSHRIILSGLTPQTTYHFVASSIDMAENITTSKEHIFKTTELGDVIIWDTNWKSPWYRPIRHVMQRKALWTQVPYGTTTEYKFAEDAMLENRYFYLYLFKSKRDCVDLVAKLDDGTTCRNEIYKVYDTGEKRIFGKGTIFAKILENTPNKIEVQHVGVGDVTTNYVIYANKPWLEIKAVKNVNQQGMHGETRICAFIKKNGDEFIIDSKRNVALKNYRAPEGSIGIINFRRINAGKYNFMWFLTFPPGAEKNRLTYLKVTRDNFFGEDVSPDRPSVTAQFAYLGKKVVIGVLGYKNCWMREDVGKPIRAGETYQTKFSPPYPGKWRLIGRVNDTYYPSDVNVTKADVLNKKRFTFTSKVDGKLDYLLMYLFDRNKDTPENIYTPLDVYRQAILKNKN